MAQAKYTNQQDIPLAIAVWLAMDEYHYIDDPHTVSVTTLIKPLRQLILGLRAKQHVSEPEDIASKIATRVGSDIHNGFEKAWLEHYRSGMEAMGHPKGLIDNILVNPLPEQLAQNPDAVAIYVEQRMQKQVGQWTITGQYDMVIDGALNDVKTTGAFNIMTGNKDTEYAMQGSLYRWLDPEKITEDHLTVLFVCTDWSAMRAKIEKDKGYPQLRVSHKKLAIESYASTDAWIQRRLTALEQYQDAPESELPKCSDKDLKRSDPKWKYYKNPAKMARATKVFTNAHDAQLRLVEDGSIGRVVEIPSTITACKYCPGFLLCTQKDEYIANGSLVV